MSFARGAAFKSVWIVSFAIATLFNVSETIINVVGVAAWEFTATV